MVICKFDVLYIIFEISLWFFFLSFVLIYWCEFGENVFVRRIMDILEKRDLLCRRGIFKLLFV